MSRFVVSSQRGGSGCSDRKTAVVKCVELRCLDSAGHGWQTRALTLPKMPRTLGGETAKTLIVAAFAPLHVSRGNHRSKEGIRLSMYFSA